MRSSKSRSRSKSNRNRSAGNNVNRVFDSSGPEGKVRGTPQQIIDKYNQLARDAQLGNDRVAFENFQQHAEHYTRLLGEAMREQEARREQQQQQQQQQNEARQEQLAQERRDAQKQGDGSANQQASGGAEVIDTGSGEGGLVETPEEPQGRARRNRKPRRPGQSGQPDVEQATAGEGTPEAAAE